MNWIDKIAYVPRNELQDFLVRYKISAKQVSSFCYFPN